MNQRKLLLAYIRNGDYAHAGEEEAIELAMNLIQKNKTQHLLDVGCGLGGTANYITSNGWGTVAGIDINREAIEYATKKFPSINFTNNNVMDSEKIFNQNTFDVIYIFNAFFCFDHQEKSLEIMSHISKNKANLIIFDYTSRHPYHDINPFDNQNSGIIKTNFFPINLSNIRNLLSNTGWALEINIDLTAKFIRWYQELIEKMDRKKNELIHIFSEKTFSEIYISYTRLLNLFQTGTIGGSVIHAINKNGSSRICE